MSKLTSWLASRRIAIDIGDSSIKLLLAEADSHQLKILRHRIIDLKEEGLLSVEEVGRQLQSAIQEFGGYEVAIAIPQRFTIAQIVDLPAGEAGDIQKLIERESDLPNAGRESAMVHGFSPLKPCDRFANPYWVTMAREEKVLQQIARAGTASVAEVVSTGNALISACLVTQPAHTNVILADLGAHSTTLAVIHQGQGVHAASFPVGSHSFTDAIATEQHCSIDEAEAAKRNNNLLHGDAASPALQRAVLQWVSELQNALTEWFDSHPTLHPPRDSIRVTLSGGGASQPGLIEFLRTIPGLQFDAWTQPPHADPTLPAGRFAVACGTALEAFHLSPQPASLVPRRLLSNRKAQRHLVIANWIAAAALVLATLFLGADLLHHRKNIRQKEERIRQTQRLQTLITGIQREYRQLQPILDRQKRTADLLQTLAVLKEARAQKEIWFVLLADRQSYLLGATISTNTTPATAPATPASRPAFIAELCVPAAGTEAMKTLSDLVATLKQTARFHNVDTLPAADRQNRVDPKLIIPNRHFAVAIELSDIDSTPPAAITPPPGRDPSNGPRTPGIGRKPPPGSAATGATQRFTLSRPPQ